MRESGFERLDRAGDTLGKLQRGKSCHCLFPTNTTVFYITQRNMMTLHAIMCKYVELLSGCSISGVTDNVCGEETCTAGEFGYTCGEQRKNVEYIGPL